MKILFVVPYVPSLIRVRPFNLIRSLRAQGHEISLVTLWTNDEERLEIKKLEEDGYTVFAERMPAWRSLYNCLKSLPTATPLQAVYSWNPSLAARLISLVQARVEHQNFDLVHIEHLRGVNYGLHLGRYFLEERNKNNPRIPLVWDSVDCISHLFAQSAEASRKQLNRLLTRFELGRTKRYEGWLVNQFDQVLVTSRVDRAALIALAENGGSEPPITVLPNGVDLDYFQPSPAVPKKLSNLVISGKMSYHANISMTLHFSQEILPLIWDQNPEVTLTVVGKNPPREILELQKHPAIEVTGTVADLRPYIQRAMVAVAPLTYGAGIQNKILEAMACGTPVVTSPQATAALEATPGEDLLVGRDPDDFALAVRSLLQNPEKNQAVGQAGLAYVRKNHHWHAITSRLEAVYRRLLAKRGVRTALAD